MRRTLAIALLGLLPTAGCGADEGAELHVFAAASLRELSEDIARTWGEPRDLELVLNIAGSATLARQIEAGARWDVFLSADEASLDAAGLDCARARAFASNRLVLVAGASADPQLRHPAELPERVRLLALAGPAVPAGRYARVLLGRLGVLEQLKGRIVDADDVRGALGLVNGGAADAALVYATDAALLRGLQVRWRAGDGEPPRIELFAIQRVAQPSEASGSGAELLDWLQGEEFRALATERGFAPPLPAGGEQ